MVGLFSRTVVAATVRMPKWFVGWVSRRYVAGSTLEDAVRIMQRLSAEGACFTVDVLGEEISNMEEAQFFLDEYVRVLQAIRSKNLDANLSIKPTAFGLLIDKEKGMANIEKLVRMANEHDMFVRLDMEDHRVTTDTIQVVIDLHKQGLTNVGTVLQGRLFRTLDDINYLETELGPAADYRPQLNECVFESIFCHECSVELEALMAACDLLQRIDFLLQLFHFFLNPKRATKHR